MKRKSIIFGEHNEDKRTLMVITKFPKKWILIDTENINFFQGAECDRIGKQWNQINDAKIIESTMKMLESKISPNKEKK